VGNDAHSHELLAVVAAVHHERVGETLNDGALGLPEALDSISAGGVGDVDGRADLDVIAAFIALADFLSCCALYATHRAATKTCAMQLKIRGLPT
jgi:hypothetical protein